MFDFPSSAKLGRKIPKTAFYERYRSSGLTGVAFPAGLKEQLQTAVDQIVLEYDLQECSTTLRAGKVNEIMVMTISFRHPPKNEKLVEFLLRNNPHKILCVVQSPGNNIAAALMVEGNFYSAAYQGQTFHISGQTLDQVWESLVEQVLFVGEPASNEPLPQRLQRRDRCLRLKAQIEKLEKKKAREVQPAKKNDLHHQLLPLREELRRLTESTTNIQENDQ